MLPCELVRQLGSLFSTRILSGSLEFKESMGANFGEGEGVYPGRRWAETRGVGRGLGNADASRSPAPPAAHVPLAVDHDRVRHARCSLDHFPDYI